MRASARRAASTAARVGMLQWNIACSEIASETSSGRRAAHRTRVMAATAVADQSHAPAGAALERGDAVLEPLEPVLGAVDVGYEPAHAGR
ncbi:MAG: hypothetical protein ACXVSF_17780 [Solirubrobacteraceae bacterium]